jgi:hypothetical protein
VKQKPAVIREFWSKVAAMGCIICGRPAQIAHCHGASIVEKMGEPKAKGKKLARYDWLVLPLCVWHHLDGDLALDKDPKGWEIVFGRQVDWIDVIASRLGLNLWKLAGVLELRA